MKLYNVQLLRAVASVMVVHAHAAGLTGLKLAWFGGANGVDLFFVISGFIIAYVAHSDAHQFMTRRLIRIVPIYWVSTLAIFALVLALPGLFHTASSDPALLARSLCFLPGGPGTHMEDGIPHPTLAGGWTLNYEMYFYVVFWVALLLSRRWASVTATLLLAVVLATVNLTGAGEWSPAVGGYGKPIVLEFVYGIAAFHLVRWIVARRERLPAPRGERLALFAVLAAGFALLLLEHELFGPGPRWLQSGLPAFAIVVAAVWLEQVHGVRVTHRIPVLIGDASYVLYLLHAYVVFGVIRLALGGRVFGELSGQLVAFGLVAVAIAAAVVVHVVCERPMLAWFKARFVRPSPARPASAR